MMIEKKITTFLENTIESAMVREQHRRFSTHHLLTCPYKKPTWRPPADSFVMTRVIAPAGSAGWDPAQ